MTISNLYQLFLADGLTTKEGGTVFELLNKTGQASVKGQAVNLSSDFDNAVVTAVNPYNVIGFMYEDGVPDGSPVKIVRDGMADMLLEDGYGSIRNGWLRLSPTTPGRVIVQPLPGYQESVDSAVYTVGSLFSGSLANLDSVDGLNAVFAEASGTPGMDIEFVFTPPEAMNLFLLRGYYENNHQNGIEIYVYDYVAAGWGPLIGTLPPGGSSDVSISAQLTSNNFNGSETRIRLLHPDAGNTNHRIYLDHLVLSAVSSSEHFKELGHTSIEVAPGIDQLVRANVHLL